MTDKEKLELINLRKRVESQREEIKRLTAQLERRNEYIKELERLFDDATCHIVLDWYNRYLCDYDALKHTS